MMNTSIPTQFHCSNHPLLQHKLSLLRDIHTPQPLFKSLLNEITLLLGYEATRDLPIMHQLIQTPSETMNAPMLKNGPPVIVPILRAGLGMVDALLTLLPQSKVGHIGIRRNEENAIPQRYYFKIPPHCQDQLFIMCDPMLATGGTAVDAVSQLQEHGVKNIRLICIVAAPEGVIHLSQKHPNVPIYAAVLDRQLDQHYYILPGLGDAGDRLYGTL